MVSQCNACRCYSQKKIVLVILKEYYNQWIHGTKFSISAPG